MKLSDLANCLEIIKKRTCRQLCYLAKCEACVERQYELEDILQLSLSSRERTRNGITMLLFAWVATTDERTKIARRDP